ncbi:uncharacterised protein [Saccharolobus solfataricus]|uniref:Uncharacterized protein n=1 Tax=Saccharolobus solfataricus TaxID=2287 RepID=A0A157SZN7_SACSO|nr:uncharacterised protein [Saccharolobus solfataricus]
MRSRGGVSLNLLVNFVADKYLSVFINYTTFENWHSVMLSIHKERIKCKLRNGQLLYLKPNEIVLLAGLKIVELNEDSVRFQFNGRVGN